MAIDNFQSKINSFLPKNLFSKGKDNTTEENGQKKEDGKHLDILHSQTENSSIHSTSNLIQEPLQEIPTEKASQKNIRTYESDVADAMAEQKFSVANVSIAESERRIARQKAEEDRQKEIIDRQNKVNNPNTPNISEIETTLKPTVLVPKPNLAIDQDTYDALNPKVDGDSLEKSNIPKKIFLVVISIIMVGAAVGGLYYLYRQNKNKVEPVAINQIKIPSIINPDTQKSFILTNSKKRELLRDVGIILENNTATQGKIAELIPVRVITDETTGKKSNIIVTSSEFIGNADFEMTDTLKRSLTDRWMLGTYTSSGEGLIVPFIILNTDFFQNAFAGMLKWENTMPDELADILNFREKTATSSLFSIKGIYKDKIIQNRDIREFISENGDILFLYTFIDKNTIVITTSESIVPAIIERIEKQTFIR